MDDLQLTKRMVTGNCSITLYYIAWFFVVAYSTALYCIVCIACYGLHCKALFLLHRSVKNGLYCMLSFVLYVVVCIVWLFLHCIVFYGIMLSLQHSLRVLLCGAFCSFAVNLYGSVLRCMVFSAVLKIIHPSMQRRITYEWQIYTTVRCLLGFLSYARLLLLSIIEISSTHVYALIVSLYSRRLSVCLSICLSVSVCTSARVNGCMDVFVCVHVCLLLHGCVCACLCLSTVDWMCYKSVTVYRPVIVRGCVDVFVSGLRVFVCSRVWLHPSLFAFLYLEPFYFRVCTTFSVYGCVCT